MTEPTVIATQENDATTIDDAKLKVSVVRFLGRDIHRETLSTICKVSFASICLLNAIGLPYIMPFFKKYTGAPFLPSKRSAVSSVLDNLPGVTGKPVLVDFGSGDGRIVFAATKRGFTASGIELNPWLYAFSRLKSVRLGGHFVFGNMWVKGPALLRETRPDVVTVYGLPGAMLERFAAVLDENLPKDKRVLVVSNQFKIPHWGMREIGSFDNFYFYEKKPST